MNLTAIITTFNSAELIAEAIDSVSFADEVIVVDSFSTDESCEIARGRGAAVLQHPYESPASQKNWAIPRAKHEWVLILDDDERVTAELGDEIRQTVGSPGAADGYEIRRRNFFLGREIRYSGWQRDWVLRLFRRDRARYEERQVHEVMACDGRVGRLGGRLLHYSYRTMDDYWKKLGRYSEWNAVEASRSGRRVSPLYMALHPPARFLKAYLLQGGFLDGVPGLAVCMLTGLSAAAKDIRIWQDQR